MRGPKEPMRSRHRSHTHARTAILLKQLQRVFPLLIIADALHEIVGINTHTLPPLAHTDKDTGAVGYTATRVHTHAHTYSPTRNMYECVEYHTSAAAIMRASFFCPRLYV